LVTKAKKCDRGTMKLFSWWPSMCFELQGGIQSQILLEKKMLLRMLLVLLWHISTTGYGQWSDTVKPLVISKYNNLKHSNKFLIFLSILSLSKKMDNDNFLDWFASVWVSGVKLILADFVKWPINEEKFCTKISKPIQCQGCVL
jgi:hypothetical protein